VVWTLIGLLDAAIWSAVALISKSLLGFLNPLVLNLVTRLVTLLALGLVAVPLVAGGMLPLGFAITWRATAYILLTAFLGWFVGYTAYLYALRIGDVSVVAPLGATDPVYTGLFAFLLLGTPLSGATIAGLGCTTAGVVAVTYWMEVRAPSGAAIAVELAGPADVLTAATDAPAATLSSGNGLATGAVRRAGLRRQVQVAALATTAAASWGLATICIQEAIAAAGAASLTLVLVYEALGCVLLAPLAWRARGRTLCRPLRSGDRRRLAVLLLACGVLDACFTMLFYVVVEKIGAVLTNVAIATSPIFAIVGGLLLLHERLNTKLALAITVTLTGVLLAVLGAR
jgi:transporter family protein